MVEAVDFAEFAVSTRSDGLSPEETLALFDPSIFMLTRPELSEEFDHLKAVLMLALGRELATLLPEQVGHWLNVLPEHHAHPQSDLPLAKAQITLLPPMYYEVNIFSFKLRHRSVLSALSLSLTPEQL